MTSENKTQPTNQNIDDFVSSLPVNQQADTRVLSEMMQSISGEPPVLWGPRIVGFGTFHYKSKSGREGDWMRIGFAPGAGKFSLYLTFDAEALISKIEGLGKYKTGKGCIYINKLSDVDTEKLRQLIELSYSSDEAYQQ